MTERPEHNGGTEMQKAVHLREKRRAHWQSEGERSLWKNLSMVGALGWLIVTPTLAGVFLGRWLDRSLGTGVVFTGALIFAGASLGFYMAWKRMNEK